MKNQNSYYIPRLIDDAYLSWHADPDRLPILLKGARQVGKTESVRHFAHQVYRRLIEVNFVKQPEYKGILQDGNVGFENQVLTLPYYTAFLLKRFLREQGEELE